MKPQNSFALTLLAMFVATALAHAQLVSGVGLKAGVAISNIRLTDVSPVDMGGGHLYTLDYMQENVVSPAVSLFANFLHEKHLGLQAELTYLRKGASHTMEVSVTTTQYPDGTGEVLKVTSEYNLHYLGFAFTAQPKLPLGDEVTLYAHLGPTANYLLDVSNWAWLEYFNRFQLGYTLGLGTEVAHLFTGNIFLELRYAGDFSPVYDHPDAKFWNQSWIVSLGTSF
jgi:hypothetical protein